MECILHSACTVLSQVSGSTIVAGALWTGYYIILSTFPFPMKDWSFEVLFKPGYSTILFNHWKQTVLNTSTWALQPVVLLHVGYPTPLSWIKSFSIWTLGSVEGTELGSLWLCCGWQSHISPPESGSGEWMLGLHPTEPSSPALILLCCL